MTSRRALAVSTLAPAFILGGCTVPAGGFTGVSVDAAGAPVAVVVMCEGEVDGLTIYFSEG